MSKEPAVTLRISLDPMSPLQERAIRTLAEAGWSEREIAGLFCVPPTREKHNAHVVDGPTLLGERNE